VEKIAYFNFILGSHYPFPEIFKFSETDIQLPFSDSEYFNQYISSSYNAITMGDMDSDEAFYGYGNYDIINYAWIISFDSGKLSSQDIAILVDDSFEIYGTDGYIDILDKFIRYISKRDGVNYICAFSRKESVYSSNGEIYSDADKQEYVFEVIYDMISKKLISDDILGAGNIFIASSDKAREYLKSKLTPDEYNGLKSMDTGHSIMRRFS